MKPYLNSVINFQPSRLLLFSPTFSRASPSYFDSAANTSAISTTIKTSGFRLCCCSKMATASPPKAVVPVRDKVEPTDIERKIFDRLLGTVRHFKLTTKLRVAGGWVRDKLLGKDCYDIDIAIDNMLGSEFVDKVSEYLETVGEEAQGVGVIARNPDQSKHLETARMRLFDLWIDFVNLRCEDYSDDSRIPTMKFGTAEQDAYRRDLTINSLFYNINEKSVEDLTGRGARFEFAIDEDLKEAARCEEVKNALAAKISKERVGTEIELMISGNQPVKAMSYISDLTLYRTVFCLPSEIQPEVSEGFEKKSTDYLDAAWSLIHSIGYASFTDQQRRLALYAALFLPFREITYKVVKGKMMPVVNYIFRESLKQKASDPELVIKIHQSLDKFATLIPSLTSKAKTMPPEVDQELEFADVPTTSKLRISTGILLREVKDVWRVCVLISTILHPSDIACTGDDSQLELEKRKDLFKAAEDAIIELGLDNVWDMKPLINGKEIINVLQLKSGGPLVREWQQKLMAWQLAHPTGTADECLDWMKETHAKRAKTQ
ncbi:tRNA nucleotidyltransferase cca2 [Linum perenne]